MDKKAFAEAEAFSRSVKEFLENPEKVKLLEKENLTSFLKFEEILGASVFEFRNGSLRWNEKYNFKNVEDLLKASADKSLREFIEYTFVNSKGIIKDAASSFYMFKNILSIQKFGLLPEIAEFIKSVPPEISSDLIEQLLTKENLDLFNKKQWQEAFKNIIYKDTQKLRDNKELNGFIKNLLLRTGQNNLNTGEIIHFENLYSYENKKEIYALCELTKEWNYSAQAREIKDIAENCEIFKDKTIFKPEFILFAKKLKEEFGLEINNLSYSIRELAKIFGDTELKNNLLNEKTISFFKGIGKKFNFRFNIKYQNVEDLIFVAKDEDFQELLKNDEAVKFIQTSLFNFNLEQATLNLIKSVSPEFYPIFHKLSSMFNFKIQKMSEVRFKLFIDSLNIIKENQEKILPVLTKFNNLGWFHHEMIEVEGANLKKITDDKILEEKIFNQENLNFINRTINTHGFSAGDIIKLTLIEEKKKRVAEQLRDDFNLKIYPYQMYEGNIAADLPSFLMLDPFIKKAVIENNFENYKIRVSQKICDEFLRVGDAAHNFLESIKEKGWITIQTYNRLYAGRRKNIGFESYAYQPKKGDSHPTINVTFYEMKPGKNHFKNNDSFSVSSYEDENGFYEGDIGNSVKIKIYPETYKIYKEAWQKYENADKSIKKKFLKNFSWYAEPKKYKEEYKQEELLRNETLPAGPALNGHSHFYFTPYGIVSGCVSEAKEQSGILSKNHPAVKGAEVITGHKEMLLDFLKTRGEILSIERGEEVIPEGAVTVKIKNLDLPKQLERMALPPNITLGEMILNLHLEQYLYKEIKINDNLLNDLMFQFINYGEIVARANGKILKLEDRIEPNTKVVFEKQKEAIAA